MHKTLFKILILFRAIVFQQFFDTSSLCSPCICTINLYMTQFCYPETKLLHFTFRKFMFSGKVCLKKIINLWLSGYRMLNDNCIRPELRQFIRY